MHRSGQDFPDQVVVSLIEMFRNMFIVVMTLFKVVVKDEVLEAGGDNFGF